MGQMRTYYKNYGKGHGIATFFSLVFGLLFGFIEIIGIGFCLNGKWVVGIILFLVGLLLGVIKIRIEISIGKEQKSL